MKIVLLQDVKSLGKAGDLVEVSEGYARNFLLPKKLGAAATAENLNSLKLKKANEAKIAAEQLAEAKALAAKAGAVTVYIKGGENGKTYGSVSTKELAEAVKEQLGLELDKKKIALAEPLKNFGSYETVVKLHREVQAKLKVTVAEEK